MKVDVIITSCGRNDLLAITLDSLKYKSGINRVFIHDDFYLRGGQLIAIDLLMNNVNTEYYLHLEEDWECLQDGFIEEAINILRANHDILSVSLRGNSHAAHNGHPIQNVNGVFMLGKNYMGRWDGFSYAPSVRRKKDFIACQSITTWNKETPYFCEADIGRYYSRLGWNFATTKTKYFNHIGNNSSTHG